MARHGPSFLYASRREKTDREGLIIPLMRSSVITHSYKNMSENII